MQEILEKYSENAVLKNLDTKNISDIINFLKENNCDYIEDIISDYLDLFTIELEEFKTKFKILNIKYNFKYLDLAKENMNLFEEFFN